MYFSDDGANYFNHRQSYCNAHDVQPERYLRIARVRSVEAAFIIILEIFLHACPTQKPREPSFSSHHIREVINILFWSLPRNPSTSIGESREPRQDTKHLLCISAGHIYFAQRSVPLACSTARKLYAARTSWFQSELPTMSGTNEVRVVPFSTDLYQRSRLSTKLYSATI